jgi:hypothetical protein
MGLLDKLLFRAGRNAPSAPAARPADSAKPADSSKPAAPRPVASFLGSPKAPPGSLKLATGDFVTHYRERFIVAGVRLLEGGGAKVQHYCLRDANGAAAVLAVEEAPEPTFSMQRPASGEVCWDADSVDFDDGTFKAAKRSEMKVRSWDDAGAATSARSVTVRELRDEDDDRVLVLEDYEGHREARVGVPVFEAELEFERAGVGRRGGVRTAALGGAAEFEETKEDEIAKGSPRAAARVLERNVGSTKASLQGMDVDENPSTYCDEWSDAKDATAEAPPARAKAVAKPASEDDGNEWGKATRLLRDRPEARRKTNA